MDTNRLYMDQLARDILPLDESLALNLFARWFDLTDSSVIEIGGAAPPAWTKRHSVSRWVSVDPANSTNVAEAYELYSGRAEALQFGSNTFDLAFSCNAFQFVSLEPSVRELYRVLNPGGYCFIYCSPVWDAPDGHQLEYTSYEGRELLFCDTPLIPPYAHHLDPAAFRAAVSDLDDQLIDVLIEHVYYSHTINREWIRSYRQNFMECGFSMVDFSTSSLIDYDIPSPSVLPSGATPRTLRLIARKPTT